MEETKHLLGSPKNAARLRASIEQMTTSGCPPDILDRLKDPTFVHLNMLRGGIAKPSLANIIHLYGSPLIKEILAKHGPGAQREGGLLG